MSRLRMPDAWKWAVGWLVLMASASGVVQAKDRLYLLTVQGRVAGADQDVENVRSVIGDSWGETTTSHHTQRGTGDLAEIQRRIDDLTPSDEDIVLFYYTGHGAIAGQRHFLQLDSGERLYRDELRERLVARGARLTVILTDCCSAYDLEVPPPEAAAAAAEDTVEQNLQRLFRSRGVADVTSAAPGQIAWGERHGGLFTSALCEVLWRPVSSWQSLFAMLRVETQANYRRFRTAGLRADSGLDGRVQALLRNQRSQAPWHYGLPDGLAIVEVFPSTAATKLENLGGKRVRPEPGDRLISINGELLRDTQHFEQIVSGLDREAPVTVVLLDQRTGQELELSGQLDQGGGWRLGLRVNALAPDEVPVNGLPIVQIFRGTAATQLTDLQGNRVRLEIGDRLLAIDDQLVLDAKHFERTVARLPRGAEITLQIINRRDGQPLELLGRLDRGGGWRLGLRVNNP